MGNKEPIDELFRTKLNDLEADTPYDSWPNIKDQLERGRRRRRIAYWRYSSVAAAVLLAFFSGYFFDSWNTSSNRQLKETGSPAMEFPQNQKKDVVNNDKVKDPSKVENQTSENSAEGMPSSQKLNPGNLAENTPAQKDETGINSPGNTHTSNRIVANNHDNLEATSQRSEQEPTNGESPGSIPDHSTDMAEADVKAKSLDLPGYLNPASLVLKEDDQLKDGADANPNSLDQFDQIKIAGLIPEHSPLPRTSPKVELSLLAGPTVPFMDVNLKEDNPSTRSNVENETLENTYATGLKILIRNDRNWEWQAGLMVNNWVQNSNNVLLAGPKPSSITNSPNPSTVNSDVSGYTSLGNVKFNQNANNEVSLTEDLSQYYLVPNIGQEYQFVEVPLGAAYYLINGRFEMKLQAGVNTRILSNSHVYLEYPDGSTSNYDALKPNDLSLQISTGPGFAYRIAPRLRLRIDPMIYYSVTPVSRGNNIDTYYHQLLFFSGLSYRF